MLLRLLSLDEPRIVNCSGLGARVLAGDDEIIPVKGQLTVLVPQPEVDYRISGGTSSMPTVAAPVSVAELPSSSNAIPVTTLTWATPGSPATVGEKKAREILYLTRQYSAEEALAMGLVNRVVPSGTAREAAETLASEIAAFPQTCLRRDRASLLEQDGLSESDALDNELRHGLVSLESDAVAGAARFVAGEGRHGAFG